MLAESINLAIRCELRIFRRGQLNVSNDKVHAPRFPLLHMPNPPLICPTITRLGFSSLVVGAYFRVTLNPFQYGKVYYYLQFVGYILSRSLSFTLLLLSSGFQRHRLHKLPLTIISGNGNSYASLSSSYVWFCDIFDECECVFVISLCYECL